MAPFNLTLVPRCTDLSPALPPALPSSIDMTDCSHICMIVCSVFQLPLQALFQAKRGSAHQALARQYAMYLMHVCCGMSFSDVGRFLGRDRTTVSHACQVIEEHREREVIDWSLNVIEMSLTMMRSQQNGAIE